MKKLLALLFSLVVFGQTQTLFTETFNSFTPDTAGAMYVLILDSVYHAVNATGLAENQDLKGDYNFTATGFSAGFDTETTDGSILYSGGKFLTFNSDNLDNTSSDLDPGTGDWTIQIWVKTSANTGNLMLFNDRTSGAAGYQVDFNGNVIRAYFLDGGALNTARTFSTNTNYYITAVYNRDGNLSLQLNMGTAGTVDISGRAAQNVTGTVVQRIGGASWTGSLYIDWGIMAVKYSKSEVSDKQLKEDAYLADGWASNSGGVTRNSFAFTQGIITDTLYYNTVLTAGTWDVSVDVDGNSGGETYQILTSADKSTWTALKSATAPASSTTVTVSGATGLGYIGLAVSSAADTVFFDNLTVSETVAIATGKFKGNTTYNKFKGW